MTTSNNATGMTMLTSDVDAALTEMEIALAEGDCEPLMLAGPLLELIRRGQAMLDDIKAIEYETRIGVIGESEAVVYGVKVKVVPPGKTKRINTMFAKELDRSPVFRKWCEERELPLELYLDADRRGYCTITEVK